MDDYIEIAVPKIDVTYVKNVLENMPNFNISDIFLHNEMNDRLKKYKTTLAVYAVRNKDNELLDYLISANVDLNVEVLSCGTPLHVAASMGNFEVVKKLHESGADINARLATTLETPLIEAVSKGYYEITEYLVDNGINVNAVTTADCDYGCTAVLLAANYGHDDIVELLLRNNAEPFGRIEPSNLNVTGVKRILSTIPNININSIFICDESEVHAPLTLVHLAVAYNNEELLDYLITSNANLNICIPRQGTALHIAAKNSDLKLIEKLIKSGADPNVQMAEWSLSPLIWAIDRGSFEVAQYLIDNGVEINAVAYNDEIFHDLNALHVAVDKGSTVLVELLLRNNADINIKSRKRNNFRSEEFTPIEVAYRDEKLDIMKLLIAHGAISDTTMVLYAVQSRNNPEILEYLLTLDLNVIDRHFTDAKLRDNSVLSVIIFGSRLGGTYCSFESFKIMINAIFNINSVDERNMLLVQILYLIDSEPDVLDYVKRHIVKLKQAGFYVCQRNIDAVREGYDHFQTECDQEIDKLKSDEIGSSNLAFYKVFHKSLHSLAIRLRHTNMDNIVNKNKLFTEYPLFGGIIYYKLAKVQRRMESLKIVEKFLDYVLNYCFKLPYTFTRELYYYLTNEQLKKLM